MCAQVLSDPWINRGGNLPFIPFQSGAILKKNNSSLAYMEFPEKAYPYFHVSCCKVCWYSQIVWSVNQEIHLLIIWELFAIHVSHSNVNYFLIDSGINFLECILLSHGNGLPYRWIAEIEIKKEKHKEQCAVRWIFLYKSTVDFATIICATCPRYRRKNVLFLVNFSSSK